MVIRPLRSNDLTERAADFSRIIGRKRQNPNNGMYKYRSAALLAKGYILDTGNRVAKNQLEAKKIRLSRNQADSVADSTISRKRRDKMTGISVTAVAGEKS